MRDFAEPGAYEPVIFLRIRCIQTDGKGIDQAFEGRCNVSPMDEISQSVCVDADWLFPMFFDEMCCFL